MQSRATTVPEYLASLEPARGASGGAARPEKRGRKVAKLTAAKKSVARGVAATKAARKPGR